MLPGPTCNKTKIQTKKEKRKESEPPPLQSFHTLIKRNGWCALDEFQVHHRGEVQLTVLRQDNPINIQNTLVRDTHVSHLHCFGLWVE